MWGISMINQEMMINDRPPKPFCDIDVQTIPFPGIDHCEPLWNTINDHSPSVTNINEHKPFLTIIHHPLQYHLLVNHHQPSLATMNHES